MSGMSRELERMRNRTTQIPVPFESYHVKTGLIRKRNDNYSAGDVLALSSSGKPLRADLGKILSSTFSEKLLRQGTEGKVIVGVSLFKEVQHLRSDVYSKDSLPLPVVSVLDPKLAGNLAKHGLDMANVINAGKQFSYALIIDMLIYMLHSLFFDSATCGSRAMFEVRTRRILLYSNLLATTSNIIVSLLGEYLGADTSRFIDWGGYLNTLRHIVFDTKFIMEVKRDFLKNELYSLITGEQYDFIEGK